MEKTQSSVEGLCRSLIASSLDDFRRQNVKAVYLKKWDPGFDYYSNICL